MNEKTRMNSFVVSHLFVFHAVVVHLLPRPEGNANSHLAHFLKYYRRYEEVDVLLYLQEDFVPFLLSSMGPPIRLDAYLVRVQVYDRMDKLHYQYLHVSQVETLEELVAF